MRWSLTPHRMRLVAWISLALNLNRLQFDTLYPDGVEFTCTFQLGCIHVHICAVCGRMLVQCASNSNCSCDYLLEQCMHRRDVACMWIFSEWFILVCLRHRIDISMAAYARSKIPTFKKNKKKNNACENEHMVSLGVFPPAFVYFSFSFTVKLQSIRSGSNSVQFERLFIPFWIHIKTRFIVCKQWNFAYRI